MSNPPPTILVIFGASGDLTARKLAPAIFNLSKDNLDLSVNNTNSGDGKESLSVKFDHDLDISFNSRYLIDVASQLDGDSIEIYLKDTGSPALIRDPSDYDSIYVVMPMKG